MITAFVAFFIDTVLGDPRTSLHPVVLMGKMIALLEKLLYRPADGNARKFLSGAMLTAIVLLVSYEAGAAFLHLSYWVTGETGLWWMNYLMGGLLLSFMISPNSLAKAGKEIYTLLEQGKLEEARQKVGWIVGRDTDKLEVDGITRATVETIAENTVDGILSPLFFFAIGGVPLAVLYRAANTMDSMIGYKNEKYLYFGRAAARVDDALNYIPARLTALLFIGSAWLLKFDHKHALRMMKRDAAKHPSPNGGYAEATMAGALHIRLGGFNSYFGVESFRAYMGDAIEKLSPKHILESIRMMYTATVLFLLLAYALFESMGY